MNGTLERLKWHPKEGKVEDTSITSGKRTEAKMGRKPLFKQDQGTCLIVLFLFSFLSGGR